MVERVVSGSAASQADMQMCFDAAQALKNDGNKLIGVGFSYRALHKYQRALDILAKFAPQSRGPVTPGFPPNFSPVEPESTQTSARSHSLHCILLSNVAACYLQLRKWNAAVQVCGELLDKMAPSLAPDIRLKTLVRRCKACAELGDWETALSDLHAVKAQSVEAWSGLAEVAKRCADMKQAHAARQRSV